MDNKSLVDILKAMSDENRLKIMSLISEKEMCACDILNYINITQPTLSHHMNILQKTGIVSFRKEGQCRFYSISENFKNDFIDKIHLLLNDNSICKCNK